MTDRLGPLDSLFLRAEDGISHMHIASCAIFEGPPPPFEQLAALIESKLPRLVRYRQRVTEVPGGIGRPVWTDDPHFNLGYHVRHTALPAPGDRATLERLMGRLMSQELDRRRPLWEAWVVEGLTDHRWALVSKVHHCMVDGISGTELMTLLLDPSPDVPPVEPQPWTPAPTPDDVELVLDAVGSLVRDPFEQVRALRAATRAPRRFLERTVDVVAGLRSYGDRLPPTRDALSIEGAIGPHRRWSSVSTTLDEIRSIRSGLGGSVNDVVLAAVTGALGRFCVARGDHVTDETVVRTLVPVSVRVPGDLTPDNQVTAMVAELPIGITDQAERYAAVRSHLDELKSSHQADAGVVVTTAAAAAPPILLSIGVRAGMAVLRRMPQRTVNTVTTNVPGPPFPLYAAGRRMTEYLPFVPLSHGVRLGFAMLSYDGTLAFGVTADFDAIPDLDDLTAAIADELDQLGALALAASTPPASGRRRAAPRAGRGSPSGVSPGASSGSRGRASRGTR